MSKREARKPVTPDTANCVTFRASFDPRTAATCPGEKDGLTLKLIVPESDFDLAFLAVRNLRGVILEVTIKEA